MRAEILSSIRQFFSDKQVLEVETPLLGNAIGCDPGLDYFSTQSSLAAPVSPQFLQTSPEFAMKRLLAAGSGCIYQICKAFRDGESGRFHNPEFTMLEWYRLDFDLEQLMDETASLLMMLLSSSIAIKAVEKISYQAIFQQHTGIDPINASLAEFSAYARRLKFFEAEQLCGSDRSCWLDFLFSHQVQVALDQQTITMVYGYPACQAALARLQTGNPNIADRFEVFINGVELGNGYYELSDYSEQKQRFDTERSLRQSRGKVAPAADQRLLAALKHGLPDCSGIALGLDRVLMLKTGAVHIDEVLSFCMQRA